MSKKNTIPDTQTDRIVASQETSIRRAWHESKWWFSVYDARAVLTDSPDAGAYWRKLKQRLNAEGSEVVTFCHGLKLQTLAYEQVKSKPPVYCLTRLFTFAKATGAASWR